MKLLYSVKEISELLGVSHTTVYTMVKNKQIPNVKIRGRIMFNKSVIEEWSKNPDKFELEKVN